MNDKQINSIMGSLETHLSRKVTNKEGKSVTVGSFLLGDFAPTAKRDRLEASRGLTLRFEVEGNTMRYDFAGSSDGTSFDGYVTVDTHLRASGRKTYAEVLTVVSEMADQIEGTHQDNKKQG